MIDSGSLAYFKAHGFSTVELIAPDSGTYQTELNTIKALGMQPVIDVEMVIIFNHLRTPGGNMLPPRGADRAILLTCSSFSRDM
jgi:hypothetical protein